MGLAKIRRKLNGEGIPGPRGAWAITGVREILNREDYRGRIITNRIQRAWDDENQRPIRVEQPESEWKVREDESLRIVEDDLWHAAHSRVEKTKQSYLRRGHLLVGQVESTKGRYLLSGFLSCGLCGKPMIATRRGRNQTLVYICRQHRERGDQACTNTTGVPAAALHEAVIKSLRETFTPETFIAHLEAQAANVQAKEQRAAERAHLLAEIPKLAAIEARTVRRIAMEEDDSLVAAIKVEWNAAKSARETAERRVAELEGIERDLRAEQSEVASLVATWKSWSATLAQTQGAADGSVPAETQAQARQILKKVLAGSSIKVTPSGAEWMFLGYTRFEKVILGGLNHAGTETWQFNCRPIVGGSGGSTVRDTDMAPHIPPQPLVTPRRSRGAPRRGVLPEDRA
jgi:Recombinase zinc beta ribbon domain/Recombinase